MRRCGDVETQTCRDADKHTAKRMEPHGAQRQRPKPIPKVIGRRRGVAEATTPIERFEWKVADCRQGTASQR